MLHISDDQKISRGPRDVLRVSGWCFKGGVHCGCLGGIRGMARGCLGSVWRCQEGYLGVSRGYLGVSRGCQREVQGMSGGSLRDPMYQI